MWRLGVFVSSNSAGSNVSRTGADYEAEVPALDRMLDRLYQDVRRTIEKEWIMISLVFPNAVAVMQLFVQRIFAQSVSHVSLPAA